MKNLNSIFTLLLASTLLFSCNRDDDTIDGESNNATTFGIRHDVSLTDYEEIATNISPFNTSEYPDFSPVLNFSYSLDGTDNQEYVASGVLISPTWVLTAGHNFFDGETQQNPAPTSGIVVNVGSNPNMPDIQIDVTELIFNPTWINEPIVIEKGNDLCLVKLATPITNITPAMLNNTNDESIGSIVWFSGYGDYSFQPGQNEDELSKRHSIENILDRKVGNISSVNQANETYFGGLVAFDFDSPLGNTNSLGDNFISDDEPLLGEGTSDNIPLPFEGGTIAGDSGGPLFILKNDQWVVIGILSGGANEPILNHNDSDYGDISIFTRVYSNIDWINSVIE